ncbi:MAG: hypothetical protein OEZ31_09520, partial [Nitrospirota bacterium]|nr:hypothetical protein [Nitrospirota bacterium]
MNEVREGKKEEKRYGIKPLVIALWFALLLLPFNGLRAALILFVVLSISIVVCKFLFLYKKIVFEGLQTFHNKIKTVRVFSAPSALMIRSLSLIFLFIFPFIATDYFIDVAILSGIYIILALG